MLNTQRHNDNIGSIYTLQVGIPTSSYKNCASGSHTNSTEGTPSALQSLLVINFKAQKCKPNINTNLNPNQYRMPVLTLINISLYITWQHHEEGYIELL